MDFQEAREQFRILAQRYQNGQINGEDFADAVDALAIIDDQGREWKIGLQSGRWYRREGKEWVEAVPPTAQEKGAAGPTERERETTRKVRNRVLMIVLLFAIASFCLGSFYFARGGQHFSLDIFGESGADSNTGENVQGGDRGGQSGGEGDQAISGTAQTTATASEDNGNVVVPEASQTAASTQSPAKPSETPTAEPPPPIAPPQVWRSLVDIQLDTPGKLTGDWSSVKQKAWEYEIINYKDRQALFIQYDSPEALLYSRGEQVVDIDIFESKVTRQLVRQAPPAGPRRSEQYDSHFFFRWSRAIVMVRTPGFPRPLLCGNQENPCPHPTFGLRAA